MLVRFIGKVVKLIIWGIFTEHLSWIFHDESNENVWTVVSFLQHEYMGVYM